jgi:hypothetical protein
MMRIREALLLGALAFAMSNTPNVALSQGKGGGKDKGAQGQGKGQSKDKDQGRGKVQPRQSGRSDDNGRGKDKDKGRDVGKDRGFEKGGRPSAVSEKSIAKRAQKFERIASRSSMPASVRSFANSRRAQDLILAAAVSHAFARGRGDDVRIVQEGNIVRLVNRNSQPLVYLDDERARNLGRWRVGVVDDAVRDGGPAFCRSGAGHPVWGREWCLDKGFGLGSYDDFRWGRTDDPGDLVFARSSLGGSLIGTALSSLLGSTAYNRLALHAVTLGLVEPLVGRWVADPGGPQVLFVNSGQYPVAELVDVNRDYRADNMLVALRSW